jgi:PilZ domain
MRERRNNFRVEWNSAAKIYDRDGQFAALCIVSNFSNGGAKILGLEPDTVPDEFILRISPRTRAQRCQVIRRSKDSLGVKFTDSAKSTSELLDRPRKSVSKRGEKYPEWA